MNERLAELYERALVIEDGGDYGSGELDPVKFAELIVKECANVCRQAAYSTTLESNVTAFMECEDAIKKQFGVK